MMFIVGRHEAYVVFRRDYSEYYIYLGGLGNGINFSCFGCCIQCIGGFVA